jgi:hypothetical protein
MLKAKQFREERNGTCNIVVVEDGEEKDLPKDELKLFESRFPLKEKIAKLKNTESPNLILNGNMDDLKLEREAASYLKLYR